MSLKLTLCGQITLTLLSLSYSVTLPATQHALVVGINQYSSSEVKPLNGAVNDAKLVRDRLRDIQVQLPDERVLLDQQASCAGVINAWHQMVKQAQPGDTLIFTYAGHGSQIEDAEPLDEQDGKDETFRLYDGCITDDQLNQVFGNAKQFNIVLVADSCHSGGLVGWKDGPSSQMCRFDAKTCPVCPQNLFSEISSTSKVADLEKLAHVTYITAQQSDTSKVCEITDTKGKPHGALSLFFAQALTGQADGNWNQRLERFELESYLKQKVSNRNKVQLPDVRPVDNRPVITLLGETVTPLSPHSMATNLPNVAIQVKNGSPPSGLTRYRLTQGNQFDLLFVIKGGRTEVFYGTGGRVATRLDSQNATQWQQIINKELLLQALATQFDVRLTSVNIELRKETQRPVRIDELHKEGERLLFRVSPRNLRSGLNALTLFNLAGTGILQFLYPLEQDSPFLMQFPYSLKLRVHAPPGGDHLVAVLCDKPPRELQKLLMETQQSFVPDPNQVIAMLHQQRCQIGLYPFFSCGRDEEECD